MPKKAQTYKGTFQCKKGDFGFVIPEHRRDFGGDFFVHKSNFGGAKDGDKILWQELDRTRGKKPEAKIVEVVTGKTHKKQREILEVVEGIYSGGNNDFGFVDIEGREQGYFVYGKKRNGAKDGDKVKAEVYSYKGKLEANVLEVFRTQKQIVEGIYEDKESFGFVKTEGESDDIFIPGGKSLEAEDGERVEVQIIKTSGRRPEGVVTKVIY